MVRNSTIMCTELCQFSRQNNTKRECIVLVINGEIKKIKKPFSSRSAILILIDNAKWREIKKEMVFEPSGES